MPPSLASSTSRSLGHLSASPAISGTTVISARWTLTPATSASVCGSASPSRSATAVDPMKLPRPPVQMRPARPRPAVCRSATSQCPSAGASPSARRASSAELVEAISATTLISGSATGRSAHHAMWNSAAAARPASSPSGLLMSQPSGEMATTETNSSTRCARSLWPVTTSAASSKNITLTTLM